MGKMKSIKIGDLKIVDKRSLGVSLQVWDKKTKKHKDVLWVNLRGGQELLEWLRKKYAKGEGRER